ncbi:MAG TPA: polyprenyl diphosphate synthase [Terriglobales bacterium]|nr:polyprenyl diphosphate synthase [Terriglobales bacterium]
MPSTLPILAPAAPRPHVAIIMDGNGRWALARGLARTRGHLAGIAAVRRVVAAAPRLGVATLTLYAFSSDNWRRSPAEVAALLALLRTFLVREREPLARAGVQCSVIGRRDRLPPELLQAIAATEAATRGGGRLHLRLALDYSGRTEIAAAAAAAAGRWTPGLAPSRELMQRLLEGALESAAGPVDLLLRTGGERRLSDFLLWESAYAELVFTRTPWPEFRARHLRRALAAFARRQRRFGGDAASAHG